MYLRTYYLMLVMTFWPMLVHSWLTISRMIHLIGQRLNVFISSNSVKFNPNLFISFHPRPLKSTPEVLHMDAKLLHLGAANVVTPVLFMQYLRSIHKRNKSLRGF